MNNVSLSIPRLVITGVVLAIVGVLVYTGKASWANFAWVAGLLFVPSPISLNGGASAGTSPGALGRQMDAQEKKRLGIPDESPTLPELPIITEKDEDPKS